MAELVRFEGAYRAFEPKDLLNAFPLLGEPVIEIGAAHDLALFRPSTRFVPGFGRLPSPTIRRAVSEQILNILSQRR